MFDTLKKCSLFHVTCQEKQGCGKIDGKKYRFWTFWGPSIQWWSVAALLEIHSKRVPGLEQWVVLPSVSPWRGRSNNAWRDLTVLFRYCVSYSVYWFPLFSILLHFYCIFLFSCDYRVGFFHYVHIITLSDLLINIIHLCVFYKKKKKICFSICNHQSNLRRAVLLLVSSPISLAMGFLRSLLGTKILGIMVPNPLCARTLLPVFPLSGRCAAHTSYLKLESTGCSSGLSSSWHPKFYINIWQEWPKRGVEDTRQQIWLCKQPLQRSLNL